MPKAMTHRRAALRAFARFGAGLIGAALGLGLVLGCQGPKEEQPELPPIKVDLPPSPNFDKPPVPLNYPDGTLSIFGLKKKPDPHIGKQIKVKAFMVEFYDCTQPKCPKGKTCKPLCDQPHFYVADAKEGPGSKYRMMVTDYPVEQKKDLQALMTATEPMVITASFERQSPSGFTSSEGLLVYKERAGGPPAAAPEGDAKDGAKGGKPVAQKPVPGKKKR
jgi:hypothetical protein